MENEAILLVVQKIDQDLTFFRGETNAHFATLNGTVKTQGEKIAVLEDRSQRAERDIEGSKDIGRKAKLAGFTALLASLSALIKGVVFDG